MPSPEILKLANTLYSAMPEAPPVPFDPERGVYLWGEVEGNEHYHFCEQIAQAILSQHSIKE